MDDSISTPPPTRDGFNVDVDVDADSRRDWEDATSSWHHEQQPSQLQNVDSSLESCRLSPTSELKRRRKYPPILSDEEKALVATAMTESKLGVLCNVCGKMLKNRDALNFHIMNTKLPGHEAALQQLVKSNFAAESMRVSAKLSEAARLDGIFPGQPQTPIVHNLGSPMTPGFSSDLQIDPKTGILVKQEPPESIPDSDEDSEFSAALAKVEVSLKSGGLIKQEPQLGLNVQTDDDLMPPPSGPAPHRRKGPKSSKNKIFKCCECHRAFKKVQKLVKHVERKHSGKKKKPDEEQQQQLQQQQQQQQQQFQLQDQEDCLFNQDHLSDLIPEENQKVEIKSESQDMVNRDVGVAPTTTTTTITTNGEKLSLKLTPMGCPDCSVIFAAKDEMMRHFAKEPHKLADGISVNRCPGEDLCFQVKAVDL